MSVRLQRLDLLRFGHFTDRSFDLPARNADFHIVFGPNEAGKSTALAAIEDLLFGIPMHSPYNFVHDYTSMRVGGVLENGSESLEVFRRKGNKDTLLGPHGSPVPGGDGVLDPFLAGADRSFFERMFSLDHVRLQDGGKEILEAKDDVGQMLFSAGAGIAGLRERLGELAAEADQLWSARRAKHRKFYIAEDKLAEAQEALREQTLTASKWRELKRAYEQAEEAYTEVDTKIKEASIERNRLSRVRRVFRDVRRKQELNDLLAEIESVITLPEEAAKIVANAEIKDAEAATRIATLQEQLKQAKENLDGLTFDEILVQRAEDIGQLHERRIEVRRAKADLPKRQAELNAAEEELRANASELGWTETGSAALIERIPPRTRISVVRSLLNQKGELEADLTNQTRLLQEAREAHDELKKQLEKASEPADVSRLAIIIKTVREKGDLTGRLRVAEQQFEAGQALVRRRLEALRPGVADEEALKSVPVPARAELQGFRDREQDLKRRLREAQQSAASIQEELDRTVAAFERTVRDEAVVTLEELSEARTRRDALWNLLKRKHVQGQPIPEDQGRDFQDELENLPGAFEPAMAKADELADRRFDHAEAAGRIAEIKRKIGEQEALREEAQQLETKLVEEGEELTGEWTSMWAAAPFEPLSADAMLEWLDGNNFALEAIEEREEAKTAVTRARNEIGEAKEQLLSELTTLGVDISVLENDDLNVIIEHAATEQRLREGQSEKKAKLETDVEDSAKAIRLRERDLRQASEALDDWRTRWTAALSALGLAEDTAPEAVGAQLDIIDQMRETASQVRTLRHDRIDMINRDVADFENVVATLVVDVAEDLSDQPADDAVLALETRLAEAKRIQELHGKKEEEVNTLSERITKLEDERRELNASISHLKQAARVESSEALKEAVERSDQKRALEQEQQQITDKLHQDGDGKSLQDLEEECQDVVIDEIAARDRSLEAELEDLHTQQTAAAEGRSQAREAFQAIGGDDAAAQAAASKQEALVEMQEIAEHYMRLKTSAILLQWAIDRYRREKQAPLLKRAGELFNIITGGSFSRLQVAFDDQDKAQLTGVRPNGAVVPVSGLSTGTADQLYLALRVAAVEDYMERADALPFVADDLLINFDDERAAEGFKLLNALSEKTQVLFFTHHQHLVDIAQKTLDAPVSVVSLTNQDAEVA